MTLKHQSTGNKHIKQPDRGRVAAARLLVKRSNEGKSTVFVSDRVRRMANGR